MSRVPEVGLPAAAAVVELSGETELAGQASELATRWILRLTVLMLAAFAVLCAIGPHIPAGE